MSKAELNSFEDAAETPMESPASQTVVPASAPRAGSGTTAQPVSSSSGGVVQAPSFPGAESLNAPGPIAGSVHTGEVKEDAAKAAIVALKTEEAADVLKQESSDVTREVTSRLEDVQRLLRDQQQLERERWEELVKRQRSDLVALRERDLELSNEVEFLRARLDRVSAERDRAIEAVQSAREQQLESTIAEREATIEQLQNKVTALQDSIQRTEMRTEVRTSKAIRELEDKKAEETKQREIEWHNRLNELKAGQADEIDRLERELEAARDEIARVRKESEDKRSFEEDFRSRNTALQRSLDKVTDENRNLRSRNEELRKAETELKELRETHEIDKRDLADLTRLRSNYNKLLAIDRQHVDELNDLAAELRRVQAKNRDLQELLESERSKAREETRPPSPVSPSPAPARQVSEETTKIETIPEPDRFATPMAEVPPVLAPSKESEGVVMAPGRTEEQTGPAA